MGESLLSRIAPIPRSLRAMSRTLTLPVLLVALTVHAGCERPFAPDEELPPAGLRIQPVPGTMVEAEDPLRLPAAVSADPLRNP